MKIKTKQVNVMKKIMPKPSKKVMMGGKGVPMPKLTKQSNMKAKSIFIKKGK